MVVIILVVITRMMNTMIEKHSSNGSDSNTSSTNNTRNASNVESVAIMIRTTGTIMRIVVATIARLVNIVRVQWRCGCYFFASDSRPLRDVTATATHTCTSFVWLLLKSQHEKGTHSSYTCKTEVIFTPVLLIDACRGSLITYHLDSAITRKSVQGILPDRDFR